MALGYAEASVNGVALEDAGGTTYKILVLDGANIFKEHKVSVTLAVDGTAYVQAIATTKGRRFGLQVVQAEKTKIDSLVAAVNTDIDAGTPFNVTVDDGFQTFNGNVHPDGDQWIAWKPQDRVFDFVEDVTMRFITV